MSIKWLLLIVMIGMTPSLFAGEMRIVDIVETVPEPASLLLLAAGAGAIGFWRWRRSKNRK